MALLTTTTNTNEERRRGVGEKRAKKGDGIYDPGFFAKLSTNLNWTLFTPSPFTAHPVSSNSIKSMVFLTSLTR